MLKCIDNQKNETVLCIHGFPEDASTWDAYIAPLSKDYNLLILDSLAPPTTESLTLEVLKHIRDLKSIKLHIICHDIGGYLATAIYPYLKTEIGSLIFISASFPQLLMRRCKKPRQLLKTWYTILFQVPVVSDFIWKKFANAIVNKLYPNDSKHLQRLERYTAWISLYRQAFFDLLSKRQDTITVPSLFIESTDDSFLEINTKDDLAVFFTNVEQRILQGGHWLVVDDSKKVIQFIYSFLERVHGQRKTSKSTEPIL